MIQQGDRMQQTLQFSGIIPPVSTIFTADGALDKAGTAALIDSMIDAGLFDGDLAIVNRAMEGRPGLIVIAALNGDALVKRLAKDGEQIVLQAENKAYAPRYVLEGDELLIWGVVTHSVHCHAPG